MTQTEEFERYRDHLRLVAYRVPGSITAADYALQGALAAPEPHQRGRGRDCALG